jgi:hypothetical protein
MGKPYSEDLRKASGCCGRDWRAVLQSGGQTVRGCHQHGHWMGATAARDWQRGAGQDGRSPISGEHRVWLLQRIKRDFTLRGLVAELAERGVKVDYRSVWEFVHAEKLLGKLRISPNLKSSCFSQSGHHPGIGADRASHPSVGLAGLRA